MYVYMVFCGYDGITAVFSTQGLAEEYAANLRRVNESGMEETIEIERWRVDSGRTGVPVSRLA